MVGIYLNLIPADTRKNNVEFLEGGQDVGNVCLATSYLL